MFQIFVWQRNKTISFDPKDIIAIILVPHQLLLHKNVDILYTILYKEHKIYGM